MSAPHKLKMDRPRYIQVFHGPTLPLSELHIPPPALSISIACLPKHLASESILPTAKVNYFYVHTRMPLQIPLNILLIIKNITHEHHTLIFFNKVNIFLHDGYNFIKKLEIYILFLPLLRQPQ